MRGKKFKFPVVAVVPPEQPTITHHIALPNQNASENPANSSPQPAAAPTPTTAANTTDIIIRKGCGAAIRPLEEPPLLPSALIVDGDGVAGHGQSESSGRTM